MVKKTKIETTTIKQVVSFAAKPEDVYDALINAEKHSAFTGAEATCDARVGGKYTAWDGYIFGKNLVLNKGKKIIQEWKTTEWPNGYPPSVVEFDFKEKGKGTELTLVQKEVPEEQAESYHQGWIDYYWEPLKEYFKQN
jgi:activator of HSP90 ATPase